MKPRTDVCVEAGRFLVATGAAPTSVLAFLDDPKNHETWGFIPSGLEAVYVVWKLFGVPLHDAVDIVRDDPIWGERTHNIMT
jgi:hypothetical protein